MLETIGILQGKQAKHNKAILTTLYKTGPRSIWQITGALCNPLDKDSDFRVKNSLHKTLSKRIRDLEKKGYVAKISNSSLWVLNFKGIVINLLIQEKYTPFSKEWQNIIKKMNLSPELLEDCQKSINWIEISITAKKLLENGVVNWDAIKNQTLATLLLSQLTTTFFDVLDSEEKARKEILNNYLSLTNEKEKS